MAFDAGSFSKIKFQGVRNNTPPKSNQVKGQVDSDTLPADPKESFQFGDKPLTDVKADSASIGKADSAQPEVRSETSVSSAVVSNSPMILQGDGFGIEGLNSIGSVNGGNGVQPQTTAFTNKVGDPTIVSSSGNIMASNSIFNPVSGSTRVPNTSLTAVNPTFELTELTTISGKPVGIVPVPTTSMDITGIESKELAYVGSSSVY